MFRFSSVHRTVAMVIAAAAILLPTLSIAWTNAPSGKKPRFEASAVQYRDDIYVFNGFDSKIEIVPSVEKFDAATRKWSIISTTSVKKGNAVTHNGIVRVGTDVWLLGGRLGNHPGKVSRQVWIFNLESKNWRRGPDFPLPVAAGGAALVNNRIHWFGGLDPFASCDVNRHFVLDLSLPSAGWQNITEVAAMPVPRNHFSTAEMDGWIYAIGGQFGHDRCPGKRGQNTNLVHAFNTKTNQWVRKADLPAPQSHNEPATFVHSGHIYSVGGQVQGNKVLRYSPTDDKWSVVKKLPGDLLAPISRVVDNNLVVGFGGAPNLANATTVVRTVPFAPLKPSGPTTQPTTPVANGSPSANGADETAVTSNELASGHHLISLEAEYFDLRSNTDTHEWIISSLTGASNAASITTHPDIRALRSGTKNSPKLTWYANFNKTGQWHLWVRGWGDTNAVGEGGSDSIHFGLNNSLAATADKIDEFPPGWNWSKHTRDGKPATLSIPSTGIHAVNAWMREDGLAIDKIVLTTDPLFVPAGDGPVDDDGTSSNTQSQSPAEPTPLTAEQPSIDTSPTATEIVSPAIVSTSSVATVSAIATPTTAAPSATTDAIVIEVENFDSRTTTASHQWVRTNKPGASKNSAMVTTPDTGALKRGLSGSPRLSYQVSFPQAGNYRVWLRGYGDTLDDEGKSDSVHVGINGALAGAKAIQNFPAKWSWSNQTREGSPASIQVPSAGEHRIDVWMREDGLILDQILLVKDTGFAPDSNAPQKSGPAVTQPTAAPTQPNPAETKPPTTTPVVSPSTDTSATQNTESLLTLEAEHFTTSRANGSHRWKIVQKHGAVNGAAVLADPNAGKLFKNPRTAPMLSYSLNFPQPGTYHVWLRGRGDTIGGEGKNDSVYVGLNSKVSLASVVQNFPAAWSWTSQKRPSGVATLQVPSSGVHTLTLWMREDGVLIDKIVLAKSADFTPSGSGPSAHINSNTPANEILDTALSQEAAPSNTIVPAPNAANSLSTGKQWLIHRTSNGSMVQKRHESGGVALNGKMYVIGGRGKRGVSVFDPKSNRWNQGAAAPIELNHFQPVAWGNKIWVLGAFTGKYPDEKPVPHIYTYTPATDKWQIAGTIPHKRRRGSTGAVLHNNKIYVVGGNTHGHRAGAKPWFDSFDPANGTWKTMPDAPQARDHITVAVADSRLVVAAGRQSAFPNTFGNMLTRADIFDFNTNKWSSGNKIPTQRAGAMTVSVGNEVVVMGGESKGVKTARNSVEAFNVTTGKWRKLQPLKVGRHSGAAAILDSKIHVVSGSERIGGSPESQVHETLLLQ